MIKSLLRTLLGVFLVIAVVSGCAAAVELTVESPSASYEAGDTIKLPVILKNDIDFAGFNIRVGNDIPSVTVTIDEERPVSGMIYTVNSEDKNDEQAIVGVITSPITDSTIHLFTIDVKINDDTVTSIPLEIRLRELLSNTEGNIDLDDVVLVDLSSINLGKTASGESIVGSVKLEIQEIPTAVPTPTYAATPVPTSVVSPSPKDTSVPAGVPTESAKTPGFGIAGILMGLIGAASISRIKFGGN